MTCGANMEYAIRTGCPLTCTNLVDYECGEKVTIEGCHCKAGFVLDNNGSCIAPANCGCRMADNSTTLMVSNYFFCFLNSKNLSLETCPRLKLHVFVQADSNFDALLLKLIY